MVVATCQACGKRSLVDAKLLQHARPPYTRLIDLERKLRCAGCGKYDGNTLTVFMAPRN